MPESNTIHRIAVSAPRALVYRVMTDLSLIATWWPAVGVADVTTGEHADIARLTPSRVMRRGVTMSTSAWEHQTHMAVAVERGRREVSSWDVWLDDDRDRAGIVVGTRMHVVSDGSTRWWGARAWARALRDACEGLVRHEHLPNLQAVS